MHHHVSHPGGRAAAGAPCGGPRGACIIMCVAKGGVRHRGAGCGGQAAGAGASACVSPRGAHGAGAEHKAERRGRGCTVIIRVLQRGGAWVPRLRGRAGACASSSSSCKGVARHMGPPPTHPPTYSHPPRKAGRAADEQVRRHAMSEGAGKSPGKSRGGDGWQGVRWIKASVEPLRGGQGRDHARPDR